MDQTRRTDRGCPRLAATAGPSPVPDRHQNTGRVETGSASSYGLAALRAELADVRHAAIGDRNNRVNRAAFCLGMLVAGGELDEHLVEDELLGAALDVGLPDREARASIRSGLRAGAREPRRRPAS